MKKWTMPNAAKKVHAATNKDEIGKKKCYREIILTQIVFPD